jgi:serralysin
VTIAASFLQADTLGRVSEVHLNGGTGQDSITGAAPVLEPGSGALLLREVFVFAPGDGQDTITGFNDGTDRILFAAGGPQSMADLVIVEGPTGAEITYGSDRVILTGLAPADLSAADFVFA